MSCGEGDISGTESEQPNDEPHSVLVRPPTGRSALSCVERHQLLQSNYITQQEELSKMYKYKRLNFTMKIMAVTFAIAFILEFGFATPGGQKSSEKTDRMLRVYKATALSPFLLFLMDLLAIYRHRLSSKKQSAPSFLYSLLDIDRVPHKNIQYLQRNKHKGEPFLLSICRLP